MRFSPLIATAGAAAWLVLPASAGSIFITGHDPDFHAFLGGNTTGARNLLNAGVNFAKDGSALPLLYIHDESTPVIGGHSNPTDGINAAGIPFVEKNATQFATENLSSYSALLLPSSFGGNLTQAELDAVNARSADLIAYLNAGGGLVALAETPLNGSFATSNLFGFLPFIVSNTAADQSEAGFTVTPFGASLGISNSDINGNASHNYFSQTGGMNVVNYDASGRIMTLAYRGTIGTTGVVPEPGTLALFATAVMPLLLRRRRATM